MDATMKALLAGLLGTYTRMVLMWAAGLLMAYARFSPAQADSVIKPILEPSTAALGSLVLVGVTGIWKFLAHRRQQQKIEVALAMPEGSTRAELKRAISESKAKDVDA